VLARYIRKLGQRTINKRDLKQSPHKSKLPGLRDKEVMDAAFQHLVEAAWLQPCPSRDGGSIGRHREDYLVNPAVLGGEA
jgi:hypothetical protein